jgi:inorganic triphosphatase YgiF
MGREIELKFELENQSIHLVPKLPILAASPFQAQSQLTIYYDTRKGKVRQNGFSLRVRSTERGFVQTVKPLDSGAALFARDEWEHSVPSIEPDLSALSETPLGELAAAGRLKKVVPVIRSEVRRTSWRMKHQSSLIAVDLDEGSMRAGEASNSFTELELELISGDAADLVEAARSMVEHVPMRLGVLSKAERGFALADGSLGKFSKAPPVKGDAGMSIADGFAAIAQSCLQHFRRNEPVVIAHRQVESLHQTRVAMRRLRSAFSLFKPVVTDEAYETLRQELRWFTNLLGEARNLDVYLATKNLAEQPSDLLRRREEAYDVIVEALNSPRFLKMMFDLVAWAATGSWRSSKKANKRLLPFARRRLDKIWDPINVTPDLETIDDEARHELRIQIKKLRYGLEFFRPLFAPSKEQKQFSASLEELQESLGRLNDMVTAEQLVPIDEHRGPVADPAADAETSQRLVAQSQRYLRRLRKTGPYW